MMCNSGVNQPLLKVGDVRHFINEDFIGMVIEVSIVSKTYTVVRLNPGASTTIRQVYMTSHYKQVQLPMEERERYSKAHNLLLSKAKLSNELFAVNRQLNSMGFPVVY